jgi:GNAT superfamily N-acetyltransferase
MEATKIRPAALEDLDILLRFEQGIIQIERPFDPTLKEGPNHYYDLPAMIASPEAELVVAEIDGVIVGCGYARIETAKHYLKHTHHAYLGFMYVEPACRGNGINSLIIEELNKWAISKNVFEMRLDVYQVNERAIRAYEKVGFKRYLVKMRLGLVQ